MADSKFTKIPNDLMEVLINPATNGPEMRVLLYIARKTFGYGKESDRISYSQFIDKTGYSRVTIAHALKNLQLVKLVKLVASGKSKKASNCYSIDISEYQDKLVKLVKLVKFYPKKLVKLVKHTKESITKESELNDPRLPSSLYEVDLMRKGVRL